MMKTLSRFVPALEWLPSYTRRQSGGDMAAGLTVGVMLIPQGMAYALLAGIPPIYGLYACIVPVVLYALLGTSRQLSVGPTATGSLLTAASVAALSAAEGSEQAVNIAVLLALLVGLMQFVLGLLRMGFLVQFLSNPVISGFASASALIIGFSQFKHLLGIKIRNTNYLHEIIGAILQQLGQIQWLALGLGLLGIVVVRQAKRLWKPLPGALAAVVLGIALSWGLDLQHYGLSIVGDIPQGLPAPVLPVWDWAMVRALLPSAAAIALVGFVESIAIARTVQNRHRNYELDANQELVALGFSKIVGSFFSSFVTTGGFSRTAVNDRAGAQTPLAGLLSALLIVATLLFLTPLFYYLPQTLLASVILASIFALVEWREALNLWRNYRSDFWTWLFAFAATLSIGILEGVLLGSALSLILVVHRSSRPHIALLGRIAGSPHFRNLARFEGLEDPAERLVVRIDADLYFANSRYVKEFLERAIEAKGAELRLVVLCAESISYIDSTASQMLQELQNKLQAQGVEWYWAAVKGPVRDRLLGSDYAARRSDQADGEWLFLSIDDAVAYYQTRSDGPYGAYARQRN